MEKKTQTKQVELSEKSGGIVGMVKIVILNKPVRICSLGKCDLSRGEGISQAYAYNKNILAMGTTSVKALGLMHV